MIQSIQIIKCNDKTCVPVNDNVITGYAFFTSSHLLGEIHDALREQGWEVVEGHFINQLKHYCPNCKEKNHEPTKPIRRA